MRVPVRCTSTSTRLSEEEVDDEEVEEDMDEEEGIWRDAEAVDSVGMAYEDDNCVMEPFKTQSCVRIQHDSETEEMGSKKSEEDVQRTFRRTEGKETKEGLLLMKRHPVMLTAAPSLIETPPSDALAKVQFLREADPLINSICAPFHSQREGEGRSV